MGINIVFKFFLYIFIISPPNAIDLTESQRAKQGELSRQPLFIVMMVELLIRAALVLIVATSIEIVIGNHIYEFYKLDIVFGILVFLGFFHALFYFVILGYLRLKIGNHMAMRIYRLLRNVCYAALPGFATVIPILIWKLKTGELPFEDGMVYTVYFTTTIIMIAIGTLEALLMKRKPLGLDNHLNF